MSVLTSHLNPEQESVKTAYLWTYILNTPFWAIYTLLAFALYKDLGASPLQVTVFVTLNPAVSLLSIYWSDYVRERRDRLVPNIVVGQVLSRIPFFFFPWMENVWWFVFAFPFYMLLHRGVVPAWMEILKLHVQDKSHYRIVSHAITFSYVGSAIFPVFFGWMMDDYYQAWRWIFPITAFISLFAVFFQLRIPKLAEVEKKESIPALSLTRPWINSWHLLLKRKDFSSFQMGFMLGGFGLMLLQPLLPEFFMSILDLNYKELGLAITMCKGLGFVMTSPIWAIFMKRASIFRIGAIVAFSFALFSVGLFLAKWNLMMLYITYVGYGAVQAGSQLSWKLSGPIFAPEEDSSSYSTVNLLMIGLRGIIANPLGGVIAYTLGPLGVMSFSFICCFFAGCYLLLAEKKPEISMESV